MISEKLLINNIYGAEIVHVLDEYLDGRCSDHSRDTQSEQKLTKVLTILPTPLPAASTIAFIFFKACSVCSSTPPGTICPVFGSRGMDPETKRRSPTLKAWV